MAAPMQSTFWHYFSIIYFLACTLCIQAFSDDEHYETLSSLTIEHTFDSGAEPVYSKRGVVTIHSITSNNAHIHQEDSHTPQDIDQLKSLVAQGGVYRIRVQTKPATSTSPAQYVNSFTTACGLYESRLSDLFTIHLDQSGGLIGVIITTTAPQCLGIDVSDRDLRTFNTSVELIQTVTGPAPETANHIQKLEQAKAEKATGTQADTRSFLAKYWMYIVPFVLIMMFANSMDPSGGQGGGGGAR